MRKLTLAIAACAALALAGCGDSEPTVKQQQAERAAQAANSINFDENAEIENIKRRLELTSNPGQVGYIVLFNETGSPILYTGVKGKVTSSGKRLTKPYSIYAGAFDVAAPSDEGTYGSSDPYIYFWDSNGVYHQWSGHYLYSDKPIRLRIEPLVVNLPPAAPAANAGVE